LTQLADAGSELYLHNGVAAYLKVGDVTHAFDNKTGELLGSFEGVYVKSPSVGMLKKALYSHAAYGHFGGVLPIIAFFGGLSKFLDESHEVGAVAFSYDKKSQQFMAQVAEKEPYYFAANGKAINPAPSERVYDPRGIQGHIPAYSPNP
jgi:hypothetical protein